MLVITLNSRTQFFFQPLIGPNDTWCLGRPTMDGKTARGASSPANPALHIPDPLSITIAATSSLMFLMKMERQPKFSLVRSNAGAKWKRPRVHPGTFKFQDLLIRNYWRQGCTPKYGHFLKIAPRLNFKKSKVNNSVLFNKIQYKS